jgi:hypothetical protein
MTLNRTQRTFIAEIKEKIRLAQYEALKVVNANLIKLYWDIGRDIAERCGVSYHCIMIWQNVGGIKI